MKPEKAKEMRPIEVMFFQYERMPCCGRPISYEMLSNRTYFFNNIVCRHCQSVLKISYPLNYVEVLSKTIIRGVTMKEFDNIVEMREAGVAQVILEEFSALVNNLALELDEPPDSISFDVELGGRLFVVEDEEDLEQIETFVEDPETKGWKNITQVGDAFDDAYLTMDDSHVVIYKVTNNAGGPTFFIPKEVADKCANIEKSICLSNNGELAHRSFIYGKSPF